MSYLVAWLARRSGSVCRWDRQPFDAAIRPTTLRESLHDRGMRLQCDVAISDPSACVVCPTRNYLVDHVTPPKGTVCP